MSATLLTAHQFARDLAASCRDLAVTQNNSISATGEDRIGVYAFPRRTEPDRAAAASRAALEGFTTASVRAHVWGGVLYAWEERPDGIEFRIHGDVEPFAAALAGVRDTSAMAAIRRAIENALPPVGRAPAQEAPCAPAA